MQSRRTAAPFDLQAELEADDITDAKAASTQPLSLESRAAASLAALLD